MSDSKGEGNSQVVADCESLLAMFDARSRDTAVEILTALALHYPDFIAQFRFQLGLKSLNDDLEYRQPRFMEYALPVQVIRENYPRPLGQPESYEGDLEHQVEGGDNGHV